MKNEKLKSKRANGNSKIDFVKIFFFRFKKHTSKQDEFRKHRTTTRPYPFY